MLQMRQRCTNTCLWETTLRTAVIDLLELERQSNRWWADLHHAVLATRVALGSWLEKEQAA